MSKVLPALPLLLAFAAAAWLARRAAEPGTWLYRADRPTPRSLHEAPVGRLGGLGILAGLALAWAGCAWAGAAPPLSIAGGALIVAAVSLVDDLRGLSPAARLGGQTLAALALAAGGLAPEALQLGEYTLGLAAGLGAVLLLAGTLWMTNLYNFMDGMDGLAGGMAVSGFGALAVLAWQGGDRGFALLAAAPAAAAGGFLVWNFPRPRARVFMGDAGSATLGFLAAALSLWGRRLGLFPLWAAALAFSPFIVDASATLARRALRGEVLWQAHREHHYQRLAGLGLSHRRIVVRAYALMLACAASAVGGVGRPTRDILWLLGAWALIYALIAWRVRLLERRRAGLS